MLVCKLYYHFVVCTRLCLFFFIFLFCFFFIFLEIHSWVYIVVLVVQFAIWYNNDVLMYLFGNFSNLNYHSLLFVFFFFCSLLSVISLLFWFILGLKYLVIILYIGILIYFLYWINSYKLTSWFYETNLWTFHEFT